MRVRGSVWGTAVGRSVQGGSRPSAMAQYGTVWHGLAWHGAAQNGGGL